MSDGPHRSLNMHRAWKRLAEYADNRAYSEHEVAEAYIPALTQTCRDEVPNSLLNALNGIFSDQQQALFGEQTTSDIAALRRDVAGLPLACAIVDGAERAASKGQLGQEVLVKVVTAALIDRGSRGNKQIEEHYYRKSSEPRSKSVRDRMEDALSGAAVESLARQQLNYTSFRPSRLQKRSDLDDGVNL